MKSYLEFKVFCLSFNLRHHSHEGKLFINLHVNYNCKTLKIQNLEVYFFEIWQAQIPFKLRT